MEVLHQIVCRTAERMLGVAVAVAGALVLLGGWLWYADRGALQAERRLQDARAAVETSITRLQARIEQLEVDVVAQQQEVMGAEKVMRELRQLKSTWDWFGGNRAQQRANQVRLDQMEARHGRAVERLTELKQELRRAKWDRDGHVIERDRLDEQLRQEAERKAGGLYTATRIWLWSRSWLLLAVAVYLAGPVLVAAVRARRRRRRLALA
jgi:hypothetical protein